MYQLITVVCSVKVFDNGDFSNSERVDMIMLYGVADRNGRLARELSFALFSNRASSRSWYL